MDLQIRHQLTLAFRLLDTASRQLVLGPEVNVFHNGTPIRAMGRTGGYLVLIGPPREDFMLGIRAKGFEPLDFPVRYAELNQYSPELTLHLVPGKTYRSPFRCISIEGNLSGINGITAIKPAESSCFIRDFDQRKRLLTIFNPHRLELDRIHYALADPEKGCFEAFCILERRSHTLFKIDRPLEMECQPSFPICPIVFGASDNEGNYCLRVRDEGGSPLWIVCWKTAEETHFKTIDIQQPETFSIL